MSGIDPKALLQALDTGNASVEMIEIALPQAKAGAWVVAEIGRTVETDETGDDFGIGCGAFDSAEAMAHVSRFAGFREIEREAADPADSG